MGIFFILKIEFYVFGVFHESLDEHHGIFSKFIGIAAAPLQVGVPSVVVFVFQFRILSFQVFINNILRVNEQFPEVDVVRFYQDLFHPILQVIHNHFHVIARISNILILPLIFRFHPFKRVSNFLDFPADPGLKSGLDFIDLSHQSVVRPTLVICTDQIPEIAK